MDVMPTGAMHEILRPPQVNKLGKADKLEIIERGNLDKKLKDYDCFHDDTSYWFMKKKKRSKSRSTKRSSSRSRSRSSGSNSNSRKSSSRKASSSKASGGKTSSSKA
jgi:hypothetical protein